MDVINVDLFDMTVEQIAKACVEQNDTGLRSLLILAEESFVSVPEKPIRALVETGQLIETEQRVEWTDDAKEIVLRAMEDHRLNPVTRVDKLLAKYRRAQVPK
ncbi:MAG TPA: hypothetical protein VE396_08285 [Xanthobacteraceae bacterium]|jgi:hypothetical protein|nr:hypothetical protein [Xanthobacteraceae bacterium]